MAWCHQAISHHPNQCWARSIMAVILWMPPGLILGLRPVNERVRETALLCNDVSHWLAANLKSALRLNVWQTAHNNPCLSTYVEHMSEKSLYDDGTVIYNCFLEKGFSFHFNSLLPGGCCCNINCAIFKHILVINVLRISNKIAHRRISQDLTEKRLTLDQVTC